MEVKEVKNARAMRDFIHFPFRLYRHDPLWVPPLFVETKKILRGGGSLLFESGPHTLYLAYEGKEVTGRLAVGIDEKLNQARGRKEGYLTLFECVHHCDTAFALFTVAEEWLRKRGMETLLGPVSPTNGDDFRGMLIENFTDPPLIFTPYNPPYYQELWEAYGFKKYHTFVAFRYDLDHMPFEASQAAIEYAQKKYDFTVRPLSYQNLHQELRAIQMILEKSLIPLEYDYLAPPSLQEVMKMAQEFKRFIPPGFAQIAWSKGEPVGFAVALPDYNQVLKLMKGRIFPLGWLTFMHHKRKINRGRAFLLFVVPAYQGKGIPTALLFEVFKEGRKRGYVFAEGSSINVENTKMCREAEGLGGIPYKKFALFRKEIGQRRKSSSTISESSPPFPGIHFPV
ncbi:MAG: GNAT family N-acetyltransferase [Candidatus Caldatribacteriaceae bacterium]